MPLVPPVVDSLVIAAVAQEVGESLAGMRIADIVQVDPTSIALLFRKSGNRDSSGRRVGLICSIHPRWARCVLVDPWPRPSGGSATAGPPFTLQLKARLIGGRLDRVETLPFERVLFIHMLAMSGPLSIVVEVMGRHSNVLLLERDRIAGVFKPVTPAMSRVRPLLPGDVYQPPPANRPTPDRISVDEVAAALSEGRPAVETLPRSVLGISPPVAAHLLLRLGMPPDRPAPPQEATRVVPELRELAEVIQRGRFAPTLYLDAASRPIAFSAIPLETYQTLTTISSPSMSAAVRAVLEERARDAAVDERREGLLSAVRAAMRRVARAEGEVERELADAALAQQWRRFGELLLAHASTVPARAAAVTLADYDGSPVMIPLDERRSAVQNAQAYFRRYKRGTRAQKLLTERLETLRSEHAYLEQVAVLAEHASSPDEILEVAADLEETAARRPAKPRRARAAREAKPRREEGRVFMIEGFRVLAGRSNRENDSITFKVASPDDLWFHARGLPGAHVIVRRNGREPPSTVVEAAAGVAAYFSRGREAGRVAVDVTLRRHVKKIKGAPPGMVTYREERTLMAEPRLPLEVESR